MSKNEKLTIREKSLILHAISIAQMDGSIYGDDTNDAEIDKALDSIVAKLGGDKMDRRR